jgi:hypothetical protein
MGTTVSKEHMDFIEKVTLGFKISYEKLVRESALHNESLVMSVNGVSTQIPATELLKRLEEKEQK